jgi:hypothetical protein
MLWASFIGLKMGFPILSRYKGGIYISSDSATAKVRKPVSKDSLNG